MDPLCYLWSALGRLTLDHGIQAAEARSAMLNREEILDPLEGGIMRKLFSTAVALVLLATLAASPVLAKAHSFTLPRDGSINGTALEQGKYKLELNGDNEAMIYQGDEMVAKAQVEVKPLANSASKGTVLIGANGDILEVRLNKQVVVFVR